jgi:hypothetical protein
MEHRSACLECAQRLIGLSHSNSQWNRKGKVGTLGIGVVCQGSPERPPRHSGRSWVGPSDEAQPYGCRRQTIIRCCSGAGRYQSILHYIHNSQRMTTHVSQQIREPVLCLTEQACSELGRQVKLSSRKCLWWGPLAFVWTWLWGCRGAEVPHADQPSTVGGDLASCGRNEESRSQLRN